MKLSANLHRFHQVFGLEKTIDVLSAAGFEGIDFNTDIEEYYTDAHSPEFYKQIKAYAADRGIGFYQTHAPFRSNFPEQGRTLQRFSQIVKGMEHSSLLGAEMIVIHPCQHFANSDQMTREQFLEANYDFYRRLLPYARDYGVKIAVENIHGYITAAAEELIELVDGLNDPMITVCFDVGHAVLAGQDPAQMICKLGSRIGCTHIHDNDGVSDLHTLPFYYSTIDWEAVMKVFAQAGYTGNLNYEAARCVSNVPAGCLPEGAKYMAAVGKYLISRFEHYRKTV